jgi:circadian clock protein KaiC
VNDERGDAVATGAATPRLSLEPTGVPNLDAVLGGGLARGALVLVVGPPGSGKTTLATQMAFAVARAGRRALVLTAMSEPASKLIEHLRAFAFFDEEAVAHTIHFMSLDQVIAEGLAAAADATVAAARQVRADLVVLDGFRGVRGAELDPQAARLFLYEVGVKLGLLGATIVITSEGDPREPGFAGEATTADVVVALRLDLLGVRHRRGLEALKARGARPLPGLHSLELGAAGAVVYPRLETRVAARRGGGTQIGADIDVEAARAAAADLERRVSTGLPALDALLGGGLTATTSTLVTGSLGTGKTLLGLHLAVASAAAGEPALFLSMRETIPQLVHKAAAFDTLRPALQAGLLGDGGLALAYVPAVDLNADIVALEVLAALDRSGARCLVIDSVAELERAVAAGGDPERLMDYLAALMEELRTRRVTPLFIKEGAHVVAAELNLVADALAVLAENLIVLQHLADGVRLRRVLSVLKMRFSGYDVLLREFAIAPEAGIRLVEPDAAGGEAPRGMR